MKLDPMQKHVMIDLETLSTRSNAVFWQIGLAEFWPASGAKVRRHSKLVDPKYRDKYPDLFHNCPVTIEWMKNNKTVNDNFELARDMGAGISFALEWVASIIHNDTIVWGNGAAFDIPILENGFNVIGQKVPWRYRNVRDTRTLWMITGDGRDEVSMPLHSLEHDAGDDAEWQAMRVIWSYRQLVEKGIISFDFGDG